MAFRLPSSCRVLVGTLISLLLPFCCLLTMGSVPSPLVPAHAGLRAAVTGSQQSTSVSLARHAPAECATVHSLPPLPRDLVMRRNTRSQAAHRVRRAKKSYRAAGLMFRRSFAASTKPPERAALSLLSMRSGRSPPSA